jgi:hypothetical protein
VFQKDFVSFSRALISQNRIDNGRIYGNRFDRTFDRIEANFGIRAVSSSRFGRSRLILVKYRAISIPATRWSHWPMIAADPNCSAPNYSLRLN